MNTTATTSKRCMCLTWTFDIRSEDGWCWRMMWGEQTREALESAREEAAAVKRKLLALEEESRLSSSVREQASMQLAEAQSELTRQTRATVDKCEELAALRKELAAAEAAHHTEMQHAQKEAMQLQYAEQQLHALAAWKAQAEPTLAELRAQVCMPPRLWWWPCSDRCVRSSQTALLWSNSIHTSMPRLCDVSTPCNP
jgi:myosin heavy subunit